MGPQPSPVFLWETMLSNQAVTEFKKIYKKEFGEEISDKEALEKGEKLLRLFQIIYKPIPKEWHKSKVKYKKLRSK